MTQLGRTPQTLQTTSGEHVEMPIAVYNADGSAANLGAVTAVTFRMARRRDRAEVVGTGLSPANATASVTAANPGVVTVVLTAAVTEALEGSYYWECFVTADGKLTLIAYGYWTFRRNVA